MQHPLQIFFRGIDETEALRGTIERHVRRLERFFPRILGCRVQIAAPHHRHRKETPYRVIVDVSMPGKEIMVSPHRRTGKSPDNVYIAISDTFRATIRRLQDYVGKRRGHVKHKISQKSYDAPDIIATIDPIDFTGVPYSELKHAFTRCLPAA